MVMAPTGVRLFGASATDAWGLSRRCRVSENQQLANGVLTQQDPSVKRDEQMLRLRTACLGFKTNLLSAKHTTSLASNNTQLFSHQQNKLFQVNHKPNQAKHPSSTPPHNAARWLFFWHTTIHFCLCVTHFVFHSRRASNMSSFNAFEFF